MNIVGVAIIAALFFVSSAWAQSTQQTNDQNVQLLLQLQALRQELADLRNQVEQQGYQLRQIQNASPSGISQNSQVTGSANASSFTQQIPVQQRQTFTNGEISANSGSVVVSPQPSNQGALQTNAAPVQNPGGVNFPLSPNQSVQSQQASTSQQNPAQNGFLEPSGSNGQANVLESGNRGIKTNLNELDLYNKGISKLNTQEYKSAASIFSAQIQNFPKGDKTADAYFWLAETFYILGDLDSSSKSYQSLVALFPQHPRTPKALIKLVGVQQERGKQDLARSALNNLIRNYANTNEASLARSKYSSLL